MAIVEPVIDAEICRICRVCQARRACRMKAIVRFDPDDLPFVDGARCRGCLVCLPACPFGAVQKPATSA